MNAIDFMPLVRWAILKDKIPRSWLDELLDALHKNELLISFNVDKKIIARRPAGEERNK